MSRPQGLRVCCPRKPGWGVGHVLADDGGARVTVFFAGNGKRTLDTTVTELDVVTGDAAVNPILDAAADANWQHAHHNLYVIELRPEIFTKERRFFEANPHRLPGQPCVYVGMTGLSPEERFQKHLRGEKDAWFVQRYGQRLLPDLYGSFPRSADPGRDHISPIARRRGIHPTLRCERIAPVHGRAPGHHDSRAARIGEPCTASFSLKRGVASGISDRQPRVP